MVTREDLEKLISAIALGSQKDFAELYNATSAKLFGICIRILNNESEAEEALQETYVKIWRYADRYSVGAASPMSWLCAIARNTAIDRYRRLMPEAGDLKDAELVADDLPSPEARALISDDVKRLENCLKELKEEHAAAVRSVYLGGWTYAETAEKLDIPLNTAKTWIRRSLLRLRECLNR